MNSSQLIETPLIIEIGFLQDQPLQDDFFPAADYTQFELSLIQELTSVEQQKGLSLKRFSEIVEKNVLKYLSNSKYFLEKELIQSFLSKTQEVAKEGDLILLLGNLGTYYVAKEGKDLKLHQMRRTLSGYVLPQEALPLLKKYHISSSAQLKELYPGFEISF